MPHLLFYESGATPTTRSMRELSTLRDHGWAITVAHFPAGLEAVRALGFASCLLPEPVKNPYPARLAAQIAPLVKNNDEAKQRIDALTGEIDRIREATGVDQLLDRQSRLVVRARDLAEEIRAFRGSPEATARAERLEWLRGRVAELAELTNQRRLAGDAGGSAAARTELDAAKAERTHLAEIVRDGMAAQRSELEAVNVERAQISAEIEGIAIKERAEVADLRASRTVISGQIRALRAARTIETPLTSGATFGDLTRLESQWHDAAEAMAAVPADLLWAADLDALPPVVWVAEATGNTPVVFDSHEIFTDLSYLPPVFREAWRMIADRFIPLATVVVATSTTVADLLRDRHGASRTEVVPNLAATSMAQSTSAATLRATIGLAADVPLAVHIGTISQHRNPGLAVDLLVAGPDLHVAFVGSAVPAVVDPMLADAEARGVRERLHLIPPVPISELTAFIADADVSLMMFDGAGAPNVALGMPNKLYDALAAGLPVIAATGTIAADFVVQEGLGARFDLGDTDTLVAAIRGVIAQPELRDRLRARVDEFAWPTIEPALCALVDDLVGT